MATSTLAREDVDQNCKLLALDNPVHMPVVKTGSRVAGTPDRVEGNFQPKPQGTPASRITALQPWNGFTLEVQRDWVTDLTALIVEDVLSLISLRSLADREDSRSASDCPNALPAPRPVMDD